MLLECVQTSALLLSLSSPITRDIFIIKTSYYYRTKLLVHRTQWHKNINFQICAICQVFANWVTFFIFLKKTKLKPFLNKYWKSQQQKGVLLPSFIIFLVSIRPLSGVIILKIAPLFLPLELFNYEIIIFYARLVIIIIIYIIIFLFQSASTNLRVYFPLKPIVVHMLFTLLVGFIF